MRDELHDQALQVTIAAAISADSFSGVWRKTATAAANGLLGVLAGGPDDFDAIATSLEKLAKETARLRKPGMSESRWVINAAYEAVLAWSQQTPLEPTRWDFVDYVNIAAFGRHEVARMVALFVVSQVLEADPPSELELEMMATDYLAWAEESRERRLLPVDPGPVVESWQALEDAKTTVTTPPRKQPPPAP